MSQNVDAFDPVKIQKIEISQNSESSFSTSQHFMILQYVFARRKQGCTDCGTC